jgi:hypothetical protein
MAAVVAAEDRELTEKQKAVWGMAPTVHNENCRRVDFFGERSWVPRSMGRNTARWTTAAVVLSTAYHGAFFYAAPTGKLRASSNLGYNTAREE